MEAVNWDLTFLYKDLNDPALEADIARIAELSKEGPALVSGPEGAIEKLERIIAAAGEMTDLINNTHGYVQLCLSTNCENQAALSLMDRLGELMIDAELCQSAWTRYIGDIDDLEALLPRSETLTQHAFVLREYQQTAKHLLPPDMEKQMLRMSLNGGDAFAKLRDRLMGGHTVELNGESLPLPAVRGMAYDPDPAVRKSAYEAELASYAKVETSMAFCISCIKGEAQTLCEAKGYPDILTQQLTENRMDRETLDAMLAAIREALPDFRRYLRLKAKLLGHEGGLPFYDLFAPVGSANLRYTAKEARALLRDTFGAVHPEMAAFMENAFDENWIDLYPAKGKEGGAFCEGFHQKKQSRVLSNFVGSFDDVSTLAHELGHAWQDRCLTRVPVLLSDLPMPLAETASIFNETMLNQTVREKCDPETRFSLLENSLLGATQTVVDIYSRYLFESAVIEARKTHIPVAAEQNQMMLDAQDQSYGDGLDKDLRHPSMWVNKCHYYFPGLHFYNFPYAFGLLFGLGVFDLYKKRGPAFLPDYDRLLASCGSGTVADVAATVGVDVRSADYWRGALSIIRGEIDEFEALCKAR